MPVVVRRSGINRSWLRRSFGSCALRGISTTQPRRRRDSSPRNIRLAAAASPRLISTEYPRRSRGGDATRLRKIRAAKALREKRTVARRYIREVAYPDPKGDWRIAPLDALRRGTLSLDGFSTPTLTVCAELDPLADQAIEYHDALVSAGAPAELWLARGTVHGFLNIREVVSRREAGLDRVAAYLGAHLGT